MFTGIVEGLGTIERIRTGAGGIQLEILSDFVLESTRIGDSVAVNGACLTVIHLGRNRFTADLSPETFERTTFKQASSGERVNLERALRLSDRLDGHLVSGHIDGTGRLVERQSAENAIVLTFSAPPALLRYMINKGSVAVDGVSLTINHCDRELFKVSVIPHTAQLTTVGTKKVGQAVNIETDLIGKYVERFTNPPGEKSPAESRGVDLALLAKSGYLK